MTEEQLNKEWLMEEIKVLNYEYFKEDEEDE